MIKKIISALLISVIAFSTIATPISNAQEAKAQANEASKIDKTDVESFAIEVLSETPNSEGFYELVGSKKVNAITEMKGNGDNLTTIVTTIEDYYNLEGVFTESIIRKEILHNDYVKGEAKTEVYEKTAKTPQTTNNDISLKSLNKSEIQTMNSSDKATVKKHVENKFKNLSSFSVTKENGKGMTKADIQELKDALMAAKFRHEQSDLISTYNYNTTLDLSAVETSSTEVNSLQTFAVASGGAYSCGATQCAGAFDNYYNYNLSTGSFTVQALSASPHQYIRLTGSTIGNTTNSTSINKFMGYINTYESYIIDKMEANSWGAVFDFALFVASLIEFVKSAGTGPKGWVAAMGMVVSIVSLLADFSSIYYATTYRANLSKTAEQYLVNAQTQLYYKNWSNYNASLVSGY